MERKAADRPVLSTAEGLTCRRLRYPALALEEGTFAFLSGPSGCGKSTYLKLLNGTLPSEPGAVLFDGAPIPRHALPLYRREVLLMPQLVWLPDGPVRGAFAFYSEYRGEAAPEAPRTEALLRVCGLDVPLSAPCARLSGGERQRLFLAVFLGLARRVLLLDEPTSALDAATAAGVLGRVRAEAKSRGLTVLTVCHDAGLTERFADRVIRLGGAT